MAKIEIGAKPMKNTEGFGKYVPTELYILYTQDNGEEVIYSGRSKNIDNLQDWFHNGMKIIKSTYSEKHSYSKDLDIEEKHIRTTLIQGDDLRLDEHLKMIDKTMEWINAGKYDYKLPTIGKWQNSNTAVRYLVESTGLEFRLPEYEDGTEVIAPGWNGDVDDPLVDLLIKRGSDKVSKFWSDFKEEVNDMESSKYYSQMDGINSTMKIVKKRANDPNTIEDVMSRVKQVQKLAEKGACGNWDGMPFTKGAKVRPDKKVGFEGIIQQEISQENAGKFKSPADIAKFAAGVVSKRGNEITDDVMEKVKKAETMAEDQTWLEKQMGLVAKATDMYQKYQGEQALPCCEVGEIETDLCKICYHGEL
jgi:hypothetical protein